MIPHDVPLTFPVFSVNPINCHYPISFFNICELEENQSHVFKNKLPFHTAMPWPFCGMWIMYFFVNLHIAMPLAMWNHHGMGSHSIPKFSEKIHRWDSQDRIHRAINMILPMIIFMIILITMILEIFFMFKLGLVWWALSALWLSWDSVISPYDSITIVLLVLDSTSISPWYCSVIVKKSEQTFVIRW